MQTIQQILAAAEASWKARRTDEATALYRQVLAMDADNTLALRRLAWLTEDAGNVEEAVALNRRLTALLPADARAHQDLGLCLRKLGRVEEALAALRRATEIDPAYSPAFCNLGLALEDSGDTSGAIIALRRAAQLRPDSGFIAYHLAAVGGAAPPAMCPPEYLVQLFDGYAEGFDEDLFKRLSYRGPALLAEITAGRGRPKPWDVIDLGCGTGMTGMPFRPDARSIVGVDLSPRMVQRAALRVMPDGARVYNSVLQTDIVAALGKRPASFDLVLAADVFIYIGDIRPVLAAARCALRPGGLIAFTTEVFPGPGDFQLCPTRRYAQSPEYVARLADELRLMIVECREAFLRKGENGWPVVGKVYLLQKPGE